MADPLGIITAASAALNAVAARLTTFLDQVDARVNAAIAAAQAQFGQSQAAYDALAGDLTGEITARMQFMAYVDPDDAAPTRLPGGTFLTLAEVFAAAPAGCYLRVFLAAGKTHELVANIPTLGQAFSIDRSGAGADPILAVRHFEVNENGDLRRAPAALVMDFGGSARFANIDIRFDGLANDEAWSLEYRSLLRTSGGGKIAANFVSCAALADDGQALVDLRGAVTADVSLFVTTLNATFAVRSEALGLARVASQSTTLTNGGAISATTTNVTTN